MRTYLVTGGAGFIGSTLCETLLNNGNKVIVIDNFCDYYDPKIKEKNISEFLYNPCLKLYKSDIRNKEELEKIFSENKIDVVCHLAAMAGVRSSIENPSLYKDVNCNGTENVLETMNKYAVKKLVFASSSSVYGNCKFIPFKEDMDMDLPISPYAETKKEDEKMIYDYSKRNNVDAVLLRFFTVYGPKQRPDLAISKFTRLMLNNEEIEMYGDGETLRDYTYIDDIVDGIVKSCDYVLNKKDENENIYEIINLGNSSPVKLKDMINTISNELKVKAKIKQMPMQQGDVNQTFADITKAKSLIGYNPKVSFEEGIKRYVDWYKNNKNLYNKF